MPAFVSSCPTPTANVTVRAPLREEWPACRALIPDAFLPRNAPETLLAIDAESRTPVACATFLSADRSVFHLRIRVIRNRRREGIGAALFQALKQLAAERKAGEIHARTNPLTEPHAEPFLLSRGFTLKSRLSTVEASMEPLSTQVFRLRQRLQANGGIPESVRIVSIGAVPREPLARLYTDLVVPELHLPPSAAASLVRDPRFSESPVLLVDGIAAGMLLIEANDGCGVGVVVARAVAPQYRHCGWVNLLLLAEGLDRGVRNGATRLRFEVPEGNSDTFKLMTRARGEITGVSAWHIWRVTGRPIPTTDSSLISD